MSQAAQFIFNAKRGHLRELACQVPFWINDLVRGGYALGSGWAVMPIEELRQVRALVHLVTRPAARAALKAERDKLSWLNPHVVGPPKIEWQRGTQAVPTCRCKVGSNTPLILWCTPESECPPLLCSKGGTVGFYALGIDAMILRRLFSWDRFARAVAKVQFAQAVDVANPYSKWAVQIAEDPKSDLNRLGVQLAEEIEEDIGRKVIYKAPPFHFMWL